MQSDIDDSVCACVSRSIRDTVSGELSISDGDYIGFVDKNILVSEKVKLSAAQRLLKKLNADKKSFIIAFYGRGVTQTERGGLESFVKENCPDAEFYGMDGGQDIYDFIFILQ